MARKAKKSDPKLVDTNLPGKVKLPDRFMLGEEGLIVLRVECTNEPHLVKQAQDREKLVQSLAIVSGFVPEEGSKLANELLEAIADAAEEDTDQIPMDLDGVESDI